MPGHLPGTLSDMTALMDELDKGPIAGKAKQFRILFVTVDPERDTREVLASYLSAFDGRIADSCLRRGSFRRSPASSRAFYEKVPTSSGYTMNHTASVYLFDREGRFAGTIDIKESRANQIAKLTRLIGG